MGSSSKSLIRSILSRGIEALTRLMKEYDDKSNKLKSEAWRSKYRASYLKAMEKRLLWVTLRDLHDLFEKSCQQNEKIE